MQLTANKMCLTVLVNDTLKTLALKKHAIRTSKVRMRKGKYFMVESG